jgi:hypothetical protein
MNDRSEQARTPSAGRSAKGPTRREYDVEMLAARLVERLEAAKGQFGLGDSARIEDLLRQTERTEIADPALLARLHEAVLFLRAYPVSPVVARLADEILFAFASRIQDPDAFAEAEVCGVAGTRFSAVFSHETARRLGLRHGRSLGLNWEDYESPATVSPALLRELPLFAEDWLVEANIPFDRWLGERGPRWLIERLDPASYETIRPALVWELGNSSVTRSRARWPGMRMFYHDGPLLKRSDVSLDAEMDAPSLPIRRLQPNRAERLLDFILATSAVRYRELHGFTWPDAQRVDWAEAGRGVAFCFLGAERSHRLPLRAYHCGMIFKNGVPVGYFETLSLFERAETGWLYARLLRFLHQKLGVTAFSIDPYQIGLHNEEAIASGAFWFYRKLGFRPLSGETETLAEREESIMRKTPGHRTPPPMLRRFAERGMIYNGTHEWDRFSVRELGLKVSQRSGALAAWPAVLSRIPGQMPSGKLRKRSFARRTTPPRIDTCASCSSTRDCARRY